MADPINASIVEHFQTNWLRVLQMALTSCSI